jgi:hypothetical protein
MEYKYLARIFKFLSDFLGAREPIRTTLVIFEVAGKKEISAPLLELVQAYSHE